MTETFTHFTPVRTSQDVTELFKARAKLRKEISNPPKSSKNPHFNSKYADLGDVISHVQAAMSKCDLDFTQTEWVNGDQPMMCTRIMHSSGQWIETDVSLLITSRRNGGSAGMQDLGSALTYARRYGLCSALGITGDDDDDGNAAQRSSTTRQSKLERTKDQLGLKAASDLPAPKPKKKKVHETAPMVSAFEQLGPNAIGKEQIEKIVGTELKEHLTDQQYENLAKLYTDLSNGVFTREELLQSIGEGTEEGNQEELFGEN